MSTPPIDVAQGHCLCADVTFRVTGSPRWVTHCHCQSCRRNTGSALATFIGYDVSKVEFVSGQRTFFSSSAGVQRGFCNRCGTPLSYESERYPNEIHLYLSTMNEPDKFPAGAHVFTAEKVSWFECHDALPRFEGTSVKSGPDAFGPLAGEPQG